MFTLKERRIFKFHDGQKVVHLDPLRILRRLEATRPARYEQLVEDINSKDPAKYSAALDVLIPWIESLFGVKTLARDGEGFTDAELVALLGNYLAFLEKKSEGSNPPSSSAPSTQESTLSEADASPTPTGSDCGCTG